MIRHFGYLTLVGRAGVSRLPWTPAEHASMAEGLLVLSDYSQTVNVSVWAFFLV